MKQQRLAEVIICQCHISRLYGQRRSPRARSSRAASGLFVMSTQVMYVGGNEMLDVELKHVYESPVLALPKQI